MVPVDAFIRWHVAPASEDAPHSFDNGEAERRAMHRPYLHLHGLPHTS